MSEERIGYQLPIRNMIAENLDLYERVVRNITDNRKKALLSEELANTFSRSSKKFSQTVTLLHVSCLRSKVKKLR
jgi:DNA replication initiation complex subunit (GINS family)